MPTVTIALSNGVEVPVSFGSDVVLAAQYAESAAASAGTAANLVSQASAFADPSATHASLGNIAGHPRIFGADPTKFYSFNALFFDIGGDRFTARIEQANDTAGTSTVSVAELVIGSGASFEGVQVVTLVPVGGSGITVELPVDFGAGTGFANNGYPGAFNFANSGLSNKVIVDTETWTDTVDAIATGIVGANTLIADEMRLFSDDYAKRLFGGGGRIAGLDPDDEPYLNYETIFFSGIPLYRIRVFLHSTKIGGGAVAIWTAQSATEIDPGDLPETIYMTMKADGADITGNDTNGNALQERGVTAILKPDWGVLTWDKNPTTYTGPTATSIRQRAIITMDEIERAWITGVVSPERRVTIGATNGQYATCVAASQAFENPEAASVITQSTYPVTNLYAPEWPTVFEVVDALEETVGVFTQSGQPNSQLRFAHGSIWRLRSDTILKKIAGAGEGPVVEVHGTCRVLGNGALIDNQSTSGYCFHVDEVNSKSKFTTGNVQRRRIQTVINDVRFLHSDITNSAQLIGAGIADGHTFVIERCDFEKLTGAAASQMILVHGSPNSVQPGLLRIADCNSNDADLTNVVFLQLIKSTAGAHRHIVAVEDTNAGSITYANSFGDGLSGWVARGDMSGLVVPAEMLP